MALTRVAVVGTSGAGKTTFARALAARLGVPHVELDGLCHLPDWVEASDEDFRRAVEAATAGCGWVVDGNYERKLGDLVRGQAETLIWLDYPRALSLTRLLQRTVWRLVRREELWNGNRETLRGAVWRRESLFAWAIRSHVRRRRRLPAALALHPELEVVRLRSPRAAARWLAEVVPAAELDRLAVQ